MKKMNFFYDKEGDLLDISLGKPRKAICEELQDNAIARKDPKTKKIIGLTILNFEKRFEKTGKRAELETPKP